MPKLDPVKAFWWAYYNDMSMVEQLETMEKMLHEWIKNFKLLSIESKQHPQGVSLHT